MSACEYINLVHVTFAVIPIKFGEALRLQMLGGQGAPEIAVAIAGQMRSSAGL